MTSKLLPFLPYSRQNIQDSDISSVFDVLLIPLITQGPVVPRFEQAVAEKVGSKYAVALNSATSALHLACLALGLGPGDRLWTSSTSFVASANCALYCGADVDFVDINPRTGLMCVDALLQKLIAAERNGCLPKIVIPVHLTGSSCDLQSIASLAARYNFSIVEDASHAIGGKYYGSYVGSCSFSDITVFSFHPVKIITAGEGGMAVTNNIELAQRMTDLRSHGITKDSSRFHLQSPGPWGYEQQSLGFNYRMNDIQAALGLSQLSRLDLIVKERNALFDSYRLLLKDFPVRLLEIPRDVMSSVHLCVIRLLDHDPKLHLELFCRFREVAIGVQLHYSPIHLQPYYRGLGFCEGQFPHSEAYALSALSLPLFPGISSFELDRVFDVLASQNFGGFIK